MSLVPSRSVPNNHNLYFSKNELTKILNLYSKGVSRGEWKDYAMNFNKYNAFFYIFKHTLAKPECVLNKSLERKRKKIYFEIISKNLNKRFENLDTLISALNRKSLKIIN